MIEDDAVAERLEIVQTLVTRLNEQCAGLHLADEIKRAVEDLTTHMEQHDCDDFVDHDECHNDCYSYDELEEAEDAARAEVSLDDGVVAVVNKWFARYGAIPQDNETPWDHEMRECMYALSVLATGSQYHDDINHARRQLAVFAPSVRQ